MRNFGIAIVLAGAAAAAICAAPLASAADSSPTAAGSAPASTVVQAIPAQSAGTVALPPGGPANVLPGDQIIGGANPYVPFGPDPFVPYGVWTQ